jgi:hypothetical protein
MAGLLEPIAGFTFFTITEMVAASYRHLCPEAEDFHEETRTGQSEFESGTSHI